LSLLSKFDEVLSHLNAEDNEMALKFRKELEESLAEDAEKLRWLQCLEGAGVDNWDGIDYADELFQAGEEE
jgi:phosphoglycerate dehydrogenase-like enzyme